MMPKTTFCTTIIKQVIQTAFDDWLKGYGAMKATNNFYMEETMKLMSPKAITFWIAVVLAVLGLIGQLGLIAAISATVGFWLLFIGFVLLALGVLLKGL